MLKLSALVPNGGNWGAIRSVAMTVLLVALPVASTQVATVEYTLWLVTIMRCVSMALSLTLQFSAAATCFV